MPHPLDRAARSLLTLLAAFCLSCDGVVDLVVEALSVPAAVRPGEEFSSTTRVCNQGEDPASADVLELSVRPLEGPGGDVPVGSRPVPPLPAGACHSEEGLLVAPVGLPDGAYRLVGRLLAAGHARTSEVFGIGDLPDLVIETLEAPPSSPPGTPFDVTARVCNQGTMWATGSVTVLYVSEDWLPPGAPGAPPDPVAGGITVPPLPPGACADLAGTGVADPPTDMPLLLVALADDAGSVPELVETNNLALKLIGVGWLPDLVVRSLSAPPSVGNGGSFQVEATVCNDGTVSSPPSDVSFYFSEDAAIAPPEPPDPSAGDFWLGALPVPSLPPGACDTEEGSLAGSVPSDGAWILGALVDESDAVEELIEPNNQLAGPLMGVGTGPDLVVAEIAPPPSAENGAAFDVDVEVCNRGTVPANPSEVTLYLSSDASLDEMPPGPDPEVGVAPVPSLPPGACSHTLVPAVADSSVTGAARVFARAELVESNNLLMGPWMGLGLDADLVVQSLTAPPSVETGAPFEATARVCNQGTMPSPPVSVAVYHTTGSTVTGVSGLDLYAGELPVDASLPPGACTNATGSLSSHPAAEGAYRIGAIVDEPDYVPELLEMNNAFTGPLMGVGSGPDLVVTQLEAPPSAFASSPLALDFEVCNQGTGPSGPSNVSFYDSSDATIDPETLPPPPDGDRWLGDAAVPDLVPGSCHSGSALLWLPTGELGERHLGAIADDADWVTELVESNNVFVGPILGVGSGPDLLITELSAPPSVLPGSSLSVATQVCNQGTAPSAPEFLELYLSSDAQIEGASGIPGSEDPWLTEFWLPPLAPGTCHDEVVMGWASVPFEGAWYVGGIVDEGGYLEELIESNNTTLGPLVGVGWDPDLVVVSLEVPASAGLGVSFPVSADVCNQGTAPSPFAAVRFYHSEDAEITASLPPYGPDVLFADLPVPSLSPGECQSVAGSGSASVLTGGPWFTGAIVDPDGLVPELLETNNTFSGPLMGLGYGADLVVSVLDAPGGLVIGAPFAADVEVCNQGTAWSSPTLASLYHSEDDRIDFPAVAETWLADVSVPDLPPGGCYPATPSIGSGVPGAGFLAGVVDEGDGISELIESNNTRLVELDVAP